MSTAIVRIIRNDPACRGALLCAALFIAGGALLLLPAQPWLAPASLSRNTAALALLVTALTGLTVFLRAGELARTLSEGERVRGVIDAIQPVRRLGRHFDCLVEYRYEVEGETLRGTVLARRATLPAETPGAAVTVCYDPARPREAVLADLYEE